MRRSFFRSVSLSGDGVASRVDDRTFQQWSRCGRPLPYDDKPSDEQL
ncbi:hypothetical protein GF342_02435 [Candidatus Woesearchaeota archaeon]|nr:hypothetical protein [Candidatus Woesearchaeota archaeon]